MTMIDQVPAAATYSPDPKRVQKHKGAHKEVPHLWVIYYCPSLKHTGEFFEMDAYRGPPYCRDHNCFLEPVDLQDKSNLIKLRQADPASKGSPQR